MLAAHTGADPGPKLITRNRVKGKSVAIVGRAASMEGSGEGAAIDARDLVVRVNTILPLTGNPEDIGSRTDAIFSCTSCGIRKRAREQAKKHDVLWWQVNKSTRIQVSKSMNTPRYVAFSGTMAIIQALGWEASEVYVTGMDLYSSGPNDFDSRKNQGLSGKLKMKVGFHSPNIEKKLLKSLLEADPRFVPWKPLLEVLMSEEKVVHFKGVEDAH